jgi:hypothetical protein
MLKRMRKESKKMRARRTRVDRMEKEDGTAREKWMICQEHEVVMLNLSILAGS